MFRLTSAFERVTGRPVPQFKPKPLFYRQPVYYMSNAQSFLPSGTPVAGPDYSQALDFELEIGFVLDGSVVSTVSSAGMQHSLGVCSRMGPAANPSIPVSFSALERCRAAAGWRRGTGCGAATH